jgi:hypothetical protein
MGGLDRVIGGVWGRNYRPFRLRNVCPSNVNAGLTVVVPAAMPCEEDKTNEWNGVETSVDLFNEEEDDNIFHPDDEIILDPKESMEAPIKRVSPSPKLVLIVGEYWDKSTNSRMAVKRDYA